MTFMYLCSNMQKSAWNMDYDILIYVFSNSDIHQILNVYERQMPKSNVAILLKRFINFSQEGKQGANNSDEDNC